MEDLLGGDAGPATGPLLPRADAGAPVYFYEFQHGPQCLKDTRPAFVKADHSDEIRFVFGGAFLKGDVVMFGKEQAWGGGGSALAGTRAGGELGRRHNSPTRHDSRALEYWWVRINQWFIDTTIPWKMPPLLFLETKMKRSCQHLPDACFCFC